MRRGPAPGCGSRPSPAFNGVQDDKSLGEPSLHVVVVHDFLTEGISASFWALEHLDAHGVLLSTSFLERCDGLLSHGVSDSGLLNFLVDRHFPQDRVVFLQLNPIRRVLAILRRDVTGCSGHAGVFVLSAL